MKSPLTPRRGNGGAGAAAAATSPGSLLRRATSRRRRPPQTITIPAKNSSPTATGTSTSPTTTPTSVTSATTSSTSPTVNDALGQSIETLTTINDDGNMDHYVNINDKNGADTTARQKGTDGGTSNSVHSRTSTNISTTTASVNELFSQIDLLLKNASTEQRDTCINRLIVELTSGVSSLAPSIDSNSNTTATATTIQQQQQHQALSKSKSLTSMRTSMTTTTQTQLIQMLEDMRECLKTTQEDLIQERMKRKTRDTSMYKLARELGKTKQQISKHHIIIDNLQSELSESIQQIILLQNQLSLQETQSKHAIENLHKEYHAKIQQLQTLYDTAIITHQNEIKEMTHSHAKQREQLNLEISQTNQELLMVLGESNGGQRQQRNLIGVGSASNKKKRRKRRRRIIVAGLLLLFILGGAVVYYYYYFDFDGSGNHASTTTVTTRQMMGSEYLDGDEAETGNMLTMMNDSHDHDQMQQSQLDDDGSTRTKQNTDDDDNTETKMPTPDITISSAMEPTAARLSKLISTTANDYSFMESLTAISTTKASGELQAQQEQQAKLSFRKRFQNFIQRIL
eukprot:CAMPEP_0119561564 /NCGR_PEP_ID=MMETSP1352-20130426/17981_1 /TAXON_ID=265584 /ORGANISM="Stauroneis constricta, Strain CCMP1120" /LENGTH=569 /DNA_ID=CAMNT_0007609791 /DNA_START=315 /DNA_END=2020 /DNA_ORIENTATION=-